MAQPFFEFEGNRRLLWIAEEWVRYADDLADWAMERLVNRRDVWSQYTLKDGKIRVVMLPIPERRKLGGYEVSASSPGALHGRCAISGDRLVAHCRLGKGKATIVADADLLNVDPGDRDSRHNLDALLVELANLE